jgi:hypothetical protein
MSNKIIIESILCYLNKVFQTTSTYSSIWQSATLAKELSSKAK